MIASQTSESQGDVRGANDGDGRGGASLRGPALSSGRMYIEVDGSEGDGSIGSIIVQRLRRERWSESDVH